VDIKLELFVAGTGLAFGFLCFFGSAGVFGLAVFSTGLNTGIFLIFGV
jgi:hypothetical protein